MLKISGAQREFLRVGVEQRFRQRLKMHLLTEHPEAVAGLSEEQLERGIAEGIKRACSHGLRAQRAVAAFVALGFVLSPHFDEHPAVQAVLRNPSLPPDLRVEALLFKLSAEEWQQAAHWHQGPTLGGDSGNF